MSKMSELYAEIETAQRIAGPLPLDDWREKVSKPLQFIEAGAEMAARHARMLPIKPDFETKAECDLAEARKVLESALANIIAAQAVYANKPVENSHAA
jgi:hypothetical protein